MMKSGTSCILALAAIIAALQPDVVVSSFEIPEFPTNRYVPWRKLDWLTKNDARFLLYVAETWNSFLSSPVERMSYVDAAEFLGLNDANYMSRWQRTNIALQHIAIDSRTWDCWINHYLGNNWEELRDEHNVSWAFEALGWNSSTWTSENPSDWPETESKRFDDLTVEETLAAERICCPAQIWDGLTLTAWEFNTDGISLAQLEFEVKYPPPTNAPTLRPTRNPTPFPTISPIVNGADSSFRQASLAPSEYVRITDDLSSAPATTPSASPTSTPTETPSGAPSGVPSNTPSGVPTDKPSSSPSLRPTVTASASPTSTPTQTPSSAPSGKPSVSPTFGPSAPPSEQPSGSFFPSQQPSNGPTDSSSPSTSPTIAPSDKPSTPPSEQPSGSFFPSQQPSNGPTDSSSPSTSPTIAPSDKPSTEPTESPSDTPTITPSFSPSFSPTRTPSSSPSSSPISSPSSLPTPSLSLTPSLTPTAEPSANPSGSYYPSGEPTVGPSISVSPSTSPTAAPSNRPSSAPTFVPSASISSAPTFLASTSPSALPISTFSCPANFTLDILTDKYPQETTWTLSFESSGEIIAQSFGYKNDLERHEDTMCIQRNTCYLFEIKDKWDDGICCQNGQGSYAGYIEYPNSSEKPLSIPGLNGGAFETSQQHKFCLDGNGDLMEGEGLGNAIGVRFNGRNGGSN